MHSRTIDLNIDEQRKKVESILKLNRNKPSEESVNYFLENTLEYLRSQIGKSNVKGDITS